MSASSTTTNPDWEFIGEMKDVYLWVGEAKTAEFARELYQQQRKVVRDVVVRDRLTRIQDNFTGVEIQNFTEPLVINLSFPPSHSNTDTSHSTTNSVVQYIDTNQHFSTGLNNVIVKDSYQSQKTNLLDFDKSSKIEVSHSDALNSDEFSISTWFQNNTEVANLLQILMV